MYSSYPMNKYIVVYRPTYICWWIVILDIWDCVSGFLCTAQNVEGSKVSLLLWCNKNCCYYCFLFFFYTVVDYSDNPCVIFTVSPPVPYKFQLLSGAGFLPWGYPHHYPHAGIRWLFKTRAQQSLFGVHI